MQQMLEVIRDVRDKLSSMEQAAVGDQPRHRTQYLSAHAAPPPTLFGDTHPCLTLSGPPPAADGALQALLADVEQFTDALTQRSASARLTRAQAQAVYALAYQLVAQGRFDKAYEYFALLTLYYPTDAAYLAGLALCYRMLGRYEQAINVYAFLATLRAQEPARTRCPSASA